jgi:hypothetical protein
MKSAKLIPDWDEETAISDHFVEELERVLRMNRIPKSEWHFIFGMISSDADMNKWIEQNIETNSEVLDADPEESWSTAKTIFINHFSRATITQDLKDKYNNTKQLSGQSVQEFGDKFKTIVFRLGYNIDAMAPLVIDKFVSGLLAKPRKMYIDRVSFYDDINPSMVPTTLDEAIRLAIKLEVKAREVERQTQVYTSIGSN